MSTPSQFGANPPPAKSGTNWLVVILIILAVIVVLCGGLCAGFTYFAKNATTQFGQAFNQAFTLSMVQAQATSAISSNAEVSGKLGAITSQDSPEPVGTFNPEAPQFTCTYKINGEKGNATATVVATKDGSNYTASDIKVQFADGSTVTVPTNNAPTDLNFGDGLDEPMTEPVNEPAAEAPPSADMPAEAGEAPSAESSTTP